MEKQAKETKETKALQPVSPFQKLIDQKFGGRAFTPEELQFYVDSLVEMHLSFQEIIPGPPPGMEQLHSSACSNDAITINSWKQQWLDQIKQNIQHYDVKKNSAMLEYGKAAMKPVLCMGSGPSLQKNIQTYAEHKRDITAVSCLHNYAFLEDNGCHADYYVNLDAGEITVPELSQGGVQGEKHYWESTKDKTLIATILSYPELLKRWKGKILFYNCPIPDLDEEIKKIIDFPLYFNMGGNTLGAAMYFSKAILGCNPVIFMGADFSFGYNHQFHPFASPYDKQFSGTIPVTDIFGNRVHTWRSYYNFKCWFDWMACGGSGGNPALWVNATEGGILGAYPEGNIRQVLQMSLKEALSMYHHYKQMPELVKPNTNTRLLI